MTRYEVIINKLHIYKKREKVYIIIQITTFKHKNSMYTIHLYTFIIMVIRDKLSHT